MKAKTGNSGVWPTAEYKIYDGPLGKVWAVGHKPSKDIFAAAYKMGQEKHFLSYISATAINTTDLEEAEKFASAILKAVKQARKMNDKLGLNKFVESARAAE